MRVRNRRVDFALKDESKSQRLKKGNCLFPKRQKQPFIGSPPPTIPTTKPTPIPSLLLFYIKLTFLVHKKM